MVIHRMHDLARDGAHFMLALSPFAFRADHAALVASLLNVAVLGALRLYDSRLRSRERLEIAAPRLRLELEGAKHNPTDGRE